ncbi:MAG: NADH-quinone oxidoreductase subunit J [Deltaproteobacteria bacterium]|nr:NADH-quinone oxidoreductase subunit J [Deltaproteobacteria bacterium]
MDAITFTVLSVLMVASAIRVVLNRSPVYSALSLVMLMSLLAVYFLYLDAHMVGVLQIIVYAGAVMVLFLFVIMLLNLQDSIQDYRQEKLWTMGILCATLFGELWFFFGRAGGESSAQHAVPEGFGTVISLSQKLFTDYLLPFEITSLLLLVAVVGAVVLAKR